MTLSTSDVAASCSSASSRSSVRSSSCFRSLAVVTRATGALRTLRVVVRRAFAECSLEFQARVSADCALAEHQCQQSAEHDAAEKQRPIRGLQGKKPSFAQNVRKHLKTRCSIVHGLTILAGCRNGCSAMSTEGTIFGCLSVTSPQQPAIPDRANAYRVTAAAGVPC